MASGASGSIGLVLPSSFGSLRRAAKGAVHRPPLEPIGEQQHRRISFDRVLMFAVRGVHRLCTVVDRTLPPV